jgi:ATP-binding cassette subfamily C protein
LDSEGEEALTTAIRNVRARGGIVVVIAHRASALAAVNKVLVLNQGQQRSFGLRDEVLGKVPAASPPFTVIVAGAGNS